MRLIFFNSFTLVFIDRFWICSIWNSTLNSRCGNHVVALRVFLIILVRSGKLRINIQFINAWYECSLTVNVKTQNCMYCGFFKFYVIWVSFFEEGDCSFLNLGFSFFWFSNFVVELNLSYSNCNNDGWNFEMQWIGNWEK
jgi:hypothetical protein